MAKKADQRLPVEKTFVHFRNDSVDRPAKHRRTNSCPQELAASQDVEKQPPNAPVRKTIKWADVDLDEEDHELHNASHNPGVVGLLASLCGAQRSPSQAACSEPIGHPHSRSRSCSEAKELTVEERQQKRKDWIAGVKETEGYKEFSRKRKNKDPETLAAPGTPDPLAPESKRQYEKKAKKWRQFLRAFGSIGPEPSTAVP